MSTTRLEASLERATACLLLAADQDPQHGATMRELAARLQVLTNDLSSSAAAAPTTRPHRPPAGRSREETDVSVEAIREGDRFEELGPTGEADVLWQVVCVDRDGRRVHLFDVDDPTNLRRVAAHRLGDGSAYRRVGEPQEAAPAAA